jgi:hypothetical protein
MPARSSIAGPQRQPVDELHHRGDGIAAGGVGHVDALDDPRPLGQAENPLESGQAPLGVDGEDLGLDVGVEFSALVEGFE